MKYSVEPESERDKRILQLRKEGLTYREIAEIIEKEFGKKLTRQRIQQICSSYNWQEYLDVEPEVLDIIAKCLVVWDNIRGIKKTLEEHGYNLSIYKIEGLTKNETVKMLYSIYFSEFINLIQNYAAEGLSEEEIIEKLAEKGYKTGVSVIRKIAGTKLPRKRRTKAKLSENSEVEKIEERLS